MRIETNPVPLPVETSGVDASRRQPGAPATSVSAPGDRADIGRVGEQVSRLVNRALDAPEIRQDRVAAVKQALSGNYQVSAAQLAHAILNRS